jgi:hypothetical protein
MTEQLGGDKAEDIVIPNEAERNEESQRAELNLEN